jgi:hypothetical protein
MWWPNDQFDGGPQHVVVQPAPGAPARDVARGISTTVLRMINPAEAARQAAESQGDAATGPAGGAAQQLGATARQFLADKGVSPAYLAVLAQAYSELADSGVKGIAPRLAELVGRRTETVKGHLKQARRDGYLTTVAGKAGGQVTDKARQILHRLDLPHRGDVGD